MADPKPYGDGLTPLVDQLAGIKSRVDTVETASGTARALAVKTLQEQVATLLAIATVEYAEFASTFTPGVAGWVATVYASVTITSPTGRIEVGYGGSLNGGNGYFCYQVAGATSGVIVDRTSIRTNPAQRLAVSGGASFVDSGFKGGVVIDVPPGELLTVSLQMYANDAFVTFFGGSIQARVAP